MAFPDTTEEVGPPGGRTFSDTQTSQQRVRTFVGPSVSIETDVPAFGAAHPDAALLQVVAREFAQFPASSRVHSVVTITYAVPDLKGIDEDYDMSAIQTQLIFDLDGNEIPNGANVFVPSQIFRKRVQVSPLTPITILGPIEGKTNDAAIFGGVQNTWLYRGATSQEIVGTSTPVFLLTHTFQYDENQWKVARENLETGAIVQHRVYDEADFTTLPGVP